MRSELTAPAIEDLSRIRAYTGQDNPVAANRIASQIVAACDRFDYLPERGRSGMIPSTRELVPLSPYVIVYRI